MKVDTRVLIVGCGAAGVTAAIGLARRQIPVVVIEGAPFPGAENWSGAVYFCENLARPEILGEDQLLQTPIERKVVKRGILMTDGRVAPGLAVRNPATFSQCFTVLRPVFDHDLAAKARLLGAEILTDTTALALLRDGDRVRGVLTDRGPIYADVVFLAEGDASHLVSREGLERKPAQPNGLVEPEFLQGIKEVLELDASTIERRFGVAPGEGACFEILLRNASLDGQTVPLNAGAFLYTNRESLSLGIVAPLANLAHFQGSHNQLMEWFKGLPAIAPLLSGAKSRAFGTKIIRGGGFHEMPRLLLPGLAVGGAASGLGVDFPCANYTGPATFMGWAFAQSVAEIERDGQGFSEDALRATYLRRVETSSYFADTQHLKEWPHFVSSSREFFGRQVDLVAGLSDAATRGEDGGFARRRNFGRALIETLPWKKLGPFRREMKAADRALGISKGFFASIPRYLIPWIINCIAFWPRKSRSGATLELVFWDSGDRNRVKPFPLIRFYRWRFGPGIAEALHHLYKNDGTPLAHKLPALRDAVATRLNLFDIVLIPLILGSTWLIGQIDRLLFGLWVKVKKPGLQRILATPHFARREESRQVTELRRVREAVSHDAKLATITYRSDPRTHIHWHAAYDKAGLPDNANSSVFSICPARVYQKDIDQSLSTSVAVLHENCVRCETCWRADARHVDWGRARGHRLVYEAPTHADEWLHESREAASLADLQRPTPEAKEPKIVAPPLATPGDEDRAIIVAGLTESRLLGRSFRQLQRSLPSLVTGFDQGLLQDLAEEALDRYARLASALRRIAGGAGPFVARAEALEAALALARPHVATRRFFQVEIDLEVLEQHHGLEICTLTGLSPESLDLKPVRDPAIGERRTALRTLIEAELSRDVVASCESEMKPGPAAKKLLLRLARSLVRPDGMVLGAGLPARDATIEEIARVSPSLAILLSQHLLALEVITRPGLREPREGVLKEVREDLLSGRILVGLIAEGVRESAPETLESDALVVLSGAVDVFAVLTADSVSLIASKDPNVEIEVTGGIGLRGAGPGTIRLKGASPRARFGIDTDPARGLQRGAFDLCAVARGMASYLSTRALDHATSRVQFPGLFKDIRGRDGLAKFGAVQDMLAGISMGTELLEALRGPSGLGRYVAAFALEVLGTSPRSLTYLTGQVLGGTAFSEEDPVCRFYRDAAALTRIPLRVGETLSSFGQRFAAVLATTGGTIAAFDGRPGPPLEPSVAPLVLRLPLRDLQSALTELATALAPLDAEARQALGYDLGRIGAFAAGIRLLASRISTEFADGTVEPLRVAAATKLSRHLVSKVRRLIARMDDVLPLIRLGEETVRNLARTGPSGAKGRSYDDYLNDGSTFASGDLFTRPARTMGLTYTPELLESDAGLRASDDETEATWRARFRSEKPGELPYPRLVEKEHHVPLSDIRFLLERGNFRMVIPEEQGGLGTTKAAYYIACTRMMRHGDPSQALIVMGSTSIGTTPIMIGLEQDLPSAKSSLESLLADGAKVMKILEDVRSIRMKADTPEVLHLAAPMKKLAEDVKTTLQKGKVLRLVFSRFLDSFQRAGIAGMKKDLPAFKAGLDDAANALAGWENTARIELSSLPARKAAHEFYLRMISADHISAFALTEPSAGSDTARIRTRAEHAHSELTRDSRGFFTFVPEGGTTPRNLFERSSFAFEGRGLVFLAPGGQRVPVEIRDFDYEARRAGQASTGRYRYVMLGGERVDIHDLGRAEEHNGKLLYRYYRVNGAKMWITNGSVAGVMVLYARTAAGPTGFMLDAHAEGLVVGKDEHKMGQRGSATNELTLDNVRIPVDQVIGIDGRGQENALETLNVGRAGLAICSAALMDELLDEVVLALKDKPLRVEQLRELGRMTLDLVAAESFAYQLVGRFDHPGTKTPRMESAIAKAFCSEALHRMLTRAERILPAEFALDTHELEKRRRDARVLTIYEGTNEIQRFLLLKDFVDTLDYDKMESDSITGETEDIAAMRTILDRSRANVAGLFRRVRTDFGSRAWQTVNLQPWLFEAINQATRCSVLAATMQRIVTARQLIDDPASARCAWLAQAASLLARDVKNFDETTIAEFTESEKSVRSGRDLLSQSIADHALIRHAEAPSEPKAPIASTISRKGRVAVIIDPRPVLGSHPRLRRGHLREPLVELSSSDRGLLQTALALKERGDVEVSVFAIGAPTAVDVVEETLALGADLAFLLNTAGRNLLATDLASALADLLRVREELTEAPFDAILGSPAASGLLLPLARRLRLPAVDRVTDLGLNVPLEGAVEAHARLANPEAEVTILGSALYLMENPVSASMFGFTSSGWRSARTSSISVIDYDPANALEVELSVALQDEAKGSEANPAGRPLEFSETVTRFVSEAGLAGGVAKSEPFEGALNTRNADSFFAAIPSLAIVEASSGGEILSGARSALAASAALGRPNGPATALVLLPASSPLAARQVIGECFQSEGIARVGILCWDELADRSHLSRARLLEMLIKKVTCPIFFAPELRAAALLSGEGRSLEDDRVLLIDGVDRLTLREGGISLSGLRFGGKLRFRVDSDHAKYLPLVICSPDFDAAPGAIPETKEGFLLDEVTIPAETDLLALALHSAGKELGVPLSDAEFIIDVGFGVGSRDGIEEVVLPLKARLEALGIKKVTIGATRKVTQDLGILPEECQIGQTGSPVNPRVLMALGVSGAPQHLEYIGHRAVVFAFNRDPEAPLMVLNRTRPKPRIYPIHGDLFVLVPRFVEALEATLALAMKGS